MIEIKEEFVGCDKYVRAMRLAGSDAIVLWLALKCHASEHLTDGFVSEEDFAVLRGAPKNKRRALEALMGCGRISADGTRGSGLVDCVPNGYQLHDYLEHSESRERLLERRRLSAERKRKQRSSEDLSDPVTQSVTRDKPCDMPRDKRVTDATCHAPVPRGRADVPNPTQLDPTCKHVAEDLTGGARKPGQRPVVRAGLLPVTQSAADWDPGNEIAAYAAELGLSERNYADVIADFREKNKRSGSETWLASVLFRFIEQKAEKLATKRQEKAPADDETGGYGSASDWSP